jgi:hypothetical protein
MLRLPEVLLRHKSSCDLLHPLTVVIPGIFAILQAYQTMFIRALLILLGVFSFAASQGQIGSWNLPGSTSSYPRILLSDTSLPGLRSRIASGMENLAFGNVCSNAFDNINTDNILDNGRRSRASQAKNAAFVYYVDLKQGSGSTIALNTVEALALKAKALSLLLTMNTSVDSITVNNLTAYDSWQWRSKEIIDYTIAIDFLKGAGVSDAELAAAKSKLKAFAGNLYKEAGRNIFGLTFWDLVKNNFQFIVAGALGTAAVELNQEDSSDINYKPVNWVNCALWQIDDQMFQASNRESERGVMTGFAEGPHYMLYSFQHLFPFFNALRNFAGDFTTTITLHSIPRSIRNPFFDPSYRLLYQWINNIRMPDGRLPALDDTFMDDYPSILLQTGDSSWICEYYFGKTNTLSPSQNFLPTLNLGGQDLTVNFLCSGVIVSATNHPADKNIMPEAGSLIFRSGNDSLATYMHVIAEHGVAHTSGGGHNHADELSFIIYSKGQLLALDPGYINYNQRIDVCNASSHNMILVDNSGPASGTPGNTGGSEAYIESSFTLPSMQYAMARTSYNSANISRKIIFVRGKYFMMGDYASSAFSRKYTWQLHGFGLENGNSSTGIFIDSLSSGKATWIKNGVSLQADIIASGNADSYQKIISRHEAGYSLTGDHSALLVSKQAAKVQFASALVPYTTSPVRTRSFSASGANYMEADGDGYHDLLITSQDSLKHLFPSSDHPGAFPSADILTDASMIYLSKNDPGEFKVLFVQNARSFEIPADSNFFRIDLDRYMDFALEAKDKTHFDAYSSRAGKIRVFTPYIVLALSGRNIQSWKYDTLTLELTVNTPDSSFFSFVTDTVARKLSKGAGIYSTNHNDLIHIYPNPSGAIATITGLYSKFDLIRVTNTLGQVCHEQVVDGMNSARILTGLPPGIYIVECIGSFNRAAIRWIIE